MALLFDRGTGESLERGDALARKAADHTADHGSARIVRRSGGGRQQARVAPLTVDADTSI